jgi:hypothetical protein
MSACLPPPRESAFRRLVDTFGATGSFLCALHCAALPLLVALVPAVGFTFLADEGFERGFVVFASAFALASLLIGFRRHRAFRALMFLIPGITVLAVGAFSYLHADPIPHAVLMAVGGTLVACAHVLNLRLSHGHVHDAGCRH